MERDSGSSEQRISSGPKVPTQLNARLRAVAALLSFTATLLVGFGVGALTSIAFQHADHTKVLLSALAWLAGLAVVFLGFYLVLRILAFRLWNRLSFDNLKTTSLHALVAPISDEARLRAKEALATSIFDLIKVGLALLSAARAIRLVLLVLAAIVATATLAVAYLQVQRLSEQNRLLVEQNRVLVQGLSETKATRVSALYIQQVVPLLNVVLESFDADERASVAWRNRAWLTSVVAQLEPYAATRVTDAHSIVCSPERGQLLVALASQAADLQWFAEGRLSFEAAAPGLADLQEINLSELDLDGADLRQCDLQGSTLIGTSLRGTLLPDASRLLGAVFATPDDWSSGADLTGAVVPNPAWFEQLAATRIRDHWHWLAVAEDESFSEFASFDYGRWEIVLDAATGALRLREHEATKKLREYLTELEKYDNTVGIGDWSEVDIQMLADLSQNLPCYGTSDHCVSRERGALLAFCVSYEIPMDEVIAAGTDFSGSVFATGDSQTPPSFDGLNLAGIKLAHSDLSSCSFRSADLKEADLSGVKLPPAQEFGGANLTDINLTGARPFDADWLVEVGRVAGEFDAENWEIVLEDTVPIMRTEDGKIVDQIEVWRIDAAN